MIEEEKLKKRKKEKGGEQILIEKDEEKVEKKEIKYDELRGEVCELPPSIEEYEVKLKDKEKVSIEKKCEKLKVELAPLLRSIENYRANLKEKSFKGIEKVISSELFPPIPRLDIKEKYSIKHAPPSEKMEVKEIKSKTEAISVPILWFLPDYITKPSEIEMIKAKDILREEIKKIEAKIKEGEEGGGREPEDVIAALFPTSTGKPLDWGGWDVICILVEKKDGRQMLEDIISTRYTFQGQYRFFKSLPWMVEKEIETLMRKEEVAERIPATLYTKKYVKEATENIKPDDITDPNYLLVSGNLPENKNEIPKIVNAIKAISNAGPKCIIIHVETLDIKKRFQNIGGAIVYPIRLPARSVETKVFISKLVGISPDEVEGENIDDMWGSAIKVVRAKMKDYNNNLSGEDVPCLWEKETELHYIKKKIVYHWLKDLYPNKSIEPEKPVSNGIRPDITVDGREYWEVETGYPCKEEMEKIPEYSNPYMRLGYKLNKFSEGETLTVNVVLPPIYAYLFKDALRRLIRDLKINLKFYTIDWSKGTVRGFMK